MAIVHVGRDIDKLFAKLSLKERNALMLMQMGWLTAGTPKLGNKEVPTITVQDLIEAVKESEA